MVWTRIDVAWTRVVAEEVVKSDRSKQSRAGAARLHAEREEGGDKQ